MISIFSGENKNLRRLSIRNRKYINGQKMLTILQPKKQCLPKINLSERNEEVKTRFKQEEEKRTEDIYSNSLNVSFFIECSNIDTKEKNEKNTKDEKHQT